MWGMVIAVKTNHLVGFSTFLPWLQSRSFTVQQINPHLMLQKYNYSYE